MGTQEDTLVLRLRHAAQAIVMRCLLGGDAASSRGDVAGRRTRIGLDDTVDFSNVESILTAPVVPDLTVQCEGTLGEGALEYMRLLMPRADLLLG
jgi:hypothetical protein